MSSKIDLDIQTHLWYVVVLQRSDFMSILDELWYGNINPSEDKEVSDKEKKLVELMARHQEYLT